MCSADINNLIETLKLPQQFTTWVDNFYRPIVQDIVDSDKVQKKQTYILGIQGMQGSGKSTLAEFLKLLLESEYQLNVVIMSIDDFYLSKQERLELSESIHPLFKTRGVPGTHDTELMTTAFKKLKNLRESETLLIPRFNKAIDDRFPKEQWNQVIGPIDVIIFEGWCVGLTAQSQQDVSLVQNDLERTEDPRCIWRQYVNEKLKKEYKVLFSLIDDLLVLQAPSFKAVYGWRLLQEQKLIDRLKVQKIKPEGNLAILDEVKLQRFIAHYERLTEHALKHLPQQARWLLLQNSEHQLLELVR